MKYPPACVGSIAAIQKYWNRRRQKYGIIGYKSEQDKGIVPIY